MSDQAPRNDQIRPAAQVCLVSAQLLPNLIPVFMLKPSAVHLVVTDGMQTQAVRLQRILRLHDIHVTVHRNAPSAGMASIRAFAEELAVRLEGQCPVLLNLTGGTKLMALAFVQVLPELLPGTEVLYTDTEHQVLESIVGSEPMTRPTEDVIDLDTYLMANGLRRRSSLCQDASWCERARQLKPLSKYLAAQSSGIGPFIGALNSAAEKALGREHEPIRALQPLKAWGAAAPVLREIARPEYGLLEIVSEDTVKFCDEPASRYLGGLWMEHYAWWTLRDTGAAHCEAGVEVEWSDGVAGQRAPNELDVVAVHRNRMLLVECKTARFGNNVAKDQEILNRLESLGRNAGGLFGKAILMSAREIAPEMRSRAAAYRLPWFDCTNLRDFRKFAKDWVHN